MTIYDYVDDIKEMLFGEKGVGFDTARASIRAELGKELVDMPPQYMMMKITNYCNSDCVYCKHARSRADKEQKQEIPLGNLEKIIDDAAALGVRAISLSGGEPLVRNDIEQIVRRITAHRIVPALLTNGCLLKERAQSLYESGLRYFVISLDSLDEHDYFAQRRTPLTPVLEGIEAVRRLMEKDESVRLHITPVITAKNIGQMEDMVRHFSAKGISVQFSPYHRFTSHMRDELAEFDADEANRVTDRLIEMKREGYLIANSIAFLRHFKAFMNEGKILPDGYSCLAGYATVYVDAYENVLPCWSGSFAPVDNLKDNSLSDIWYGEKYTELRKRMAQCRCPGCWLLCTGELTMLINGEE